MGILSRPARRLGLISTFAAAALCVGPAVGSAAASGLIPTKTTVAASADIISPSDSTTLTATVVYGLHITPTGTVTFVDKTNSTVLGTAKLSSPCLVFLKECQAQLVVTGAQLAPGDNLIKASYSGDGLSKASSGSTHLYTPLNAGEQASCNQFQFCEAMGRSPDGSAFLDVQAGGSNNSGGETVLVSFGTEQLTCSTPHTGDIGIFNVSDPTVPEFVVMRTFGQFGGAAQAAHPIDAQGNGGHVCFDSPTPFTTASGGPATKQADGSYQGVLPACVFTNNNVDNPPCYDGGSFNPSEGGGGTYEQRVILVAAFPTDPKMGP